MLNIKKIATIATTLALSTLTFCAQAAVPVPSGWYINGNLGYVNTNGTNSNSGTGLNINFGYLFIPYFGAEIGYTDYRKANSHAWDGAVKGIIPFQDTGVDVFAKLGFAQSNGSGTSNSTDLYYAAGGDYYFTPNTAVVLQWSQMNSNDTPELWAVGLAYTFG